MAEAVPARLQVAGGNTEGGTSLHPLGTRQPQAFPRSRVSQASEKELGGPANLINADALASRS